MKPISFFFKETTRIDERDINKNIESLSDYVDYLKKVSQEKGYGVSESSINIPFDKELQENIIVKARDLTDENLKFVLVIGTGGSNLGTRAIYEAIRGSGNIHNNKFPQMLFLDSLDSLSFNTVLNTLKSLASTNEFLINIISKSGNTTETVANTESCVKELIGVFGEDVYSRIVVSTEKKSTLWKFAKKHKTTLLALPKNIGGRFSVFSAVGLFPLTAVGIDVGMLLRGARKGQSTSLQKLPLENPALISASLIYEHYKQGIAIHNTFLFEPALESLGKWYRQLMGESIGKKHNTSGETVVVGIMPIVSIGPRDLHSVGQLYLRGPKDKFTFFIKIKTDKEKNKIPDTQLFSDSSVPVAGKTFSEITDAIYEGVLKAYKNNNRPFAEIVLEERDEFNLGYFLQMRMIEIMYLAKLLDVNAFDQPGVEDYKKETRKLLNSKEL